jgi:uncharacterized protein (TIGR03437 family)
MGVLPGFSVSQATAISSTGVVTGYSSTPGFQLVPNGAVPAVGSSQGWIYAKGVLTPLPPTGQTGTIPISINASGQVVGFTGSDAASSFSGFLYQNGAYTQPLGVPQPSFPVAINDAGQVAIMLNPTADDESVEVWNNGPTTGLSMPPGGTFAVAYGMSANGNVAGTVAFGLSGGHVDQPAVWINKGQYTTFSLPSGVTEELAFGVNNSGQAVGFIADPIAEAYEAGLFENGSSTELGKFDGNMYNIARAINDSGWVVGYGTSEFTEDLGNNVIGLSDQAGWYVVAPGSGRSFLWINGSFYDLLSLVNDSSGWELDFAFSINDAGQIVGTGFHNGVQTGFLLTPVKQEAAAISSSANPAAAGVAPGSLASAYGTDLATGNPGSTSLPLPTSFGGTSVSILDSSGTTTLAPLVYVIPTQVNFEVPPGTATGAAQVTITSGDGTLSNATLQIAPVAPGLFELNTGGLAAAYVILYHADGTQTLEQVYTVNNAGAIVASPVSLGSATDLAYLFLFGTGFDAAGTAGVTLSIGGANIPIAYAGVQGGFVGLDQVNVELPASLAGSGNVTIQLSAAGLAANPVNITIQ